MNLTSPSQVKAWCIENGFHPNRVLGQNFLIDRNALEAIVDAGLDGVPAGAPVLEIGPGLGVLTEEMLRRGHPVVAIEKDPVLAARLAAEGRIFIESRATVPLIAACGVLPPYHGGGVAAPPGSIATMSAIGSFGCNSTTSTGKVPLSR